MNSVAISIYCMMTYKEQGCVQAAASKAKYKTVTRELALIKSDPSHWLWTADDINSGPGAVVKLEICFFSLLLLLWKIYVYNIFPLTKETSMTNN